MHFSLCSIVLLAACLLLSFNGKSKQTITFGTGIFPPDMFIDPESGRCSGHIIDTVNKIFIESDFLLQAVCPSAARIYRMLENDEIDLIVNVTTTAQLEGLVTFVTLPYRELNISLFNHQDNKLSKTVSAVRGYQYNGERKRLLSQGFEFYDLPDSANALQFFLKKRSAYILTYREPFIYMLNNSATTFEHNIEEKRLSSLTNHFAISNKSAMFDQIKSALHHYATKHERKYFLDDDAMNLYLSDKDSKQ